MGGRRRPAPVDPQIAIRAQQASAQAKAQAEAQAAAKAQADAAAAVESERVATEKGIKDKAIRGGESAEDISLREQQTLRDPKKARVRGRRSLISGDLGSGSGGGKETLG